MHQSFRDGFEKIAYDYDWEVEDMTHDRMKRQYDTPMHKGKAMGIGAGLLGTAGAIGGALKGMDNGKKKGLKFGLLGGAAGAGIGALGGYMAAKHDENDIEDARNVMTMEPDRRRSLLTSRARQAEKQQDYAAMQNAAVSGGYVARGR
jgi:hypothetical protein